MDIKEILLKEQYSLEQEFEENIEKYFSFENLAPQKLNDSFRINAISTQLTATWLKNIIPKIDSYSEFCKRITALKELLEDKRYILAATMSEISFLSFALSSQEEITEEKLMELMSLDKNKIYFTKNRVKAMLEDVSKMSTSLKNISSEAALDASRIIIKLKQDQRFKKLEVSSGYKIDVRYCKKNTHKTDNLNEQLNYGNYVLDRLLVLRESIVNKSKKHK